MIKPRSGFIVEEKAALISPVFGGPRGGFDVCDWAIILDCFEIVLRCF